MAAICRLRPPRSVGLAGRDRVCGLPVCAVSRPHRSGPQLVATVEVTPTQSLVTSGIYGVIRHPIYAAMWLWGAAQALLLSNWIAGLAALILFGLVYFVRVPREEQMMLDHFGDEYRAYMQRTGRAFPRF
ncbi:MAG: isoprenylcysteine carboxylmethyltransferase family protein [Chloroflexi bacterium]|nr:isoprenylcysteine carboxylmethyltransferase family protein [Chloroflexota bacterium]